MKKLGYTLAEALIAIGIIGVIASILLPMSHKLNVDSNKVLYLKTYDTFVKMITDIATNVSIYPVVVDDFEADDYRIYTDVPLYNNQSVTIDDTEIKGGDNKLCYAIAYASGNSNQCSDSYTPFSGNGTMTPSIEFVNGVTAYITTYYAGDSDAPKYDTEVWIDVNGDGPPNCTYSTDCKWPDRFKFEIGVNGYLIAGDKAGQYYLNTRRSLRKKSIDISQVKLYESPKLWNNPPVKTDKDKDQYSVEDPE